MRRDDQYLHDILRAGADIDDFIVGLDADIAYQAKEVRNAVLFSFCVIGEAAGRVSDELKSRHPEIPWRDVKDFRNVIAHGYFKLEWPRIWEAATRRLPAFLADLKAILSQEFPDSRPDED